MRKRICPLCRRGPRRAVSKIAASAAAVAVGAMALGALSVGAMAIGSLAIKRLALLSGRIRRLSIDLLEVGRLTIREDARRQAADDGEDA